MIQWHFFRQKIKRGTDLRVKMSVFRLNVDSEVLHHEAQQVSLGWVFGNHLH